MTPMEDRPGDIRTPGPRWDVVAALAEVTRLALESGHPDIAQSWTRTTEWFCHPQLVAPPVDVHELIRKAGSS